MREVTAAWKALAPDVMQVELLHDTHQGLVSLKASVVGGDASWAVDTIQGAGGHAVEVATN